MERSGAAPTLDEYVVARGQDLLRTAWLLTGDEARAGQLARGALAAVWRRSSEPVRWREGSLDAAVRKALVSRYVRRWPRGEGGRAGERDAALPADPEPEPWSAGWAGAPAGSARDDDEARLRRDVLAALAALPRVQRAVVVLRYDSGLDDAQVAEVLGRSAGGIHTERVRALSALGHSPALADDRAEPELPERLALAFDTIVPASPDITGLAQGAREYAARSRRTRIAAVAGGSFLVLALGFGVAAAVDTGRSSGSPQSQRRPALTCAGLKEAEDLPRVSAQPLSRRATAVLVCADRSNESIWPGSLPPDEPLDTAQGLDYLVLAPPVDKDAQCARLPVGPAFTITILGKNGQRTTYDNVDLACNGWPALDRYFIALGEQQANEGFNAVVDPFPSCPSTLGQTLKERRNGPPALPKGTVFTAASACLHQSPDPSRIPTFRHPQRAVFGAAALAALTAEAATHGSGPASEGCDPSVPQVAYVVVRAVTSRDAMVELTGSSACGREFLVNWTRGDYWRLSTATANSIEAMVGGLSNDGPDHS